MERMNAPHRLSATSPLEEEPIKPAKMNMPKSFTKEDVRIAERFAKEISSHLKDRVAAVILDRNPRSEHSGLESSEQIPVIVFLDDLSRPLINQDIHGYINSTSRIVQSVSKRLHVTTIKLSEHWDLIKLSEPTHLDRLRYGVSIYDRGFFEPVRQLVTRGRMRPSLESESIYSMRADSTLKNSSAHITQATLDLYWAGIDACHAALMSQGVIPPEPHDVSKLVEIHLVRKKLVDSDCAKIMDMLYNLSRSIMHRQIQKIDGKDYEHYYAQTSKLIKRMERVVWSGD